MKAPAEKSPDTQRQAAAHAATQQQASAEAEYAFVDNREETADLRQLQEIAGNSPQAEGLSQLSAMMNNGHRSAAMQNLQAMVDNSPRQFAQRQQHSGIQGATMGLQAASDNMMTVQRVEDEELLQGKFADESSVQLAQPPDDKPNNTGLPDNLKSGIESLSGMSMDNVKVHYNSSEPAQLNAHAYAQGTDIHVGPGQEQYLPHEAWHVVQQAQGRVKPTMQMKDGVEVNDDRGLEAEADLMGGMALNAKPSEKSLVEFSASQPIQSHQLRMSHAKSESKGTLWVPDRVVQLAPHDNNVGKRVVSFHNQFAAQHLVAPFSVPQTNKEAADYILAGTAAGIMDSAHVPGVGGGQTAVTPGVVEDYINWVKSQLDAAGVVGMTNPESTILWGGTWNGLGTTMNAVLRPGGEPVGSQPSIAWSGVWGLLAHRRKKKNSPTIYVMGHMLNDNIGGPGLAYNLTPLMGKHKNWGATDSNDIHLRSVENDVKGFYDRMHNDPTDVSRVDYNVTAVYGRPPRTNTIKDLLITLQDYQADMAQVGMDQHRDVQNYILGSIHVVSKANIKAVSTAVGANWNMDPNDVLFLMQANHALWIQEDAYVPVRLDCDYTWYDGAAIPTASGNIQIPVTLPNDIKATYQ